jgi:hypothetical protein
MDLRTAVAGAAGHAFFAWMPLDAFGAITFAAAATSAGRALDRLWRIDAA